MLAGVQDDGSDATASKAFIYTGSGQSSHARSQAIRHQGLNVCVSHKRKT
jgi:hypothetical protein